MYERDHNLPIYGPIQGLIIGDNNTITVVYQSGERQIVPFLAPPKPPYPLIGRDEVLADIKHRLVEGTSLALSALNGKPGVGKTALAIALVYDKSVMEYFPDGVLWAGLGRKPDTHAVLGRWAQALGVSRSEISELTDIRKTVNAIQAAIGKRRMLLVIDDAWQADAALTFKFGAPNCSFLVTSRFPEIGLRFAGKNTLEITELNEDDGVLLLEQFIPEGVKLDSESAKTLVRSVGGLPLALVLMGHYLRKEGRASQPRRIKTALKALHEAEVRLMFGVRISGTDRGVKIKETFNANQEI